MSENRTPVVDQIFGQNRAPIDAVLEADFADLRARVAEMASKFNALPATIAGDDDLATVGRAVRDANSLLREIDSTRMNEGRPILEAQRALNAYFKDTLPDTLPALVSAAQRRADAYVREVEAKRRAEAERQAREAREREERERQRADQAKSAEAAANAQARAEREAQRAEEAEARAGASAADLTRMKGQGVSASGRASWKATILPDGGYQQAIAPLGVLGNFFDRASVEKALNSMARVQKDAAAWPGVKFHQDVKASFR